MFFLNLYRRVRMLEGAVECQRAESSRLWEIHQRCHICSRVTHEPTQRLGSLIYLSAYPVHPSCVPGTPFDRRATPPAPEKKAK